MIYIHTLIRETLCSVFKIFDQANDFLAKFKETKTKKLKLKIDNVNRYNESILNFLSYYIHFNIQKNMLIYKHNSVRNSSIV